MVRAGMADIANAIVLSCETGYAKPDVRIYQAALRRLAVAPSDALFIDDAPGHVTAAESLGMVGHLHTSTADTSPGSRTSSAHHDEHARSTVDRLQVTVPVRSWEGGSGRPHRMPGRRAGPSRRAEQRDGRIPTGFLLQETGQTAEAERNIPAQSGLGIRIAGYLDPGTALAGGTGGKEPMEPFGQMTNHVASGPARDRGWRVPGPGTADPSVKSPATCRCRSAGQSAASSASILSSLANPRRHRSPCRCAARRPGPRSCRPATATAAGCGRRPGRRTIASPARLHRARPRT